MSGDVSGLANTAVTNSPGGNTGQAASQTALIQGLNGVNLVVGTVANWLQVAEFLVTVLENALAAPGPDPIALLESLEQGVQEILQNVQALEAETKMLSLTALVQAARDRLNTLLLEGPTGNDVNEPLFFEQAQDAAYTLQDQAYWIRPYRDDLTFGALTLDGYMPNNGRPSTVQYDGAAFVFDPALPSTALAVAISVFTSVVAMFHQSDPQTLQPYCTDLATFLNTNYATMVAGLVMVPIPSTGTISDLALGALPEGVYGYVDGQSLPITFFTGNVWHGEIGAYDVYSVFGSPTPGNPYYGTGYPSPAPTDGSGLLMPTANAGCIIDIYPTLGTLMEEVNATARGFREIPYAYLWFYMRMRLGNLVRFKALYLSKGYGEIWTLVQKLRALSGGQPGRPSTRCRPRRPCRCPTTTRTGA